MNKEEILKKLAELKSLTNAVCKKFIAEDGEYTPSRLINKRILHCLDSNYSINDAGKESYGVLILGARDNLYGFHKDIDKYLNEHGWPDVHILTRWPGE